MTADDMKTTAKDIADRVDQNTKKATTTLQDVSETYAGQARGVAGQIGDAAQDLYWRARDRVQDAAGNMPGSAGDAIDAGQRAYRQGSKTLSKHVGKQPVEALLLAGAIGYLVGWAVNRS